MNRIEVVKCVAAVGVGVLGTLLVACAGSSQPSAKGSESASPACAPSEGPEGVVAAGLTLPAIDAPAPVEYPGLHQVVAYGKGLYSGAAPEGPEAMTSLKRLGFKTVVSVDGAAPEAEAARALGMRYVHLPIGYNGMTKERTLEIARAIRDLPGPVYVHCHHGKHRSAGAAGAAAVTLGLATNAQALARMKTSGTAANYTGLFQCVSVAQLATTIDLDGASGEFPERWVTSGLVAGMVEADHAFDHLREIEKAGWKAPKDHPDLVPAAEAGRLADLMRVLSEDAETKSRGAECAEWFVKAAREIVALEDGLVKNPTDMAGHTARMKVVTASCKECHVKYRD
ncbi:MAG: hypothetical protein ACT4PL_00140 [Phycisphaerales bacterium]